MSSEAQSPAVPLWRSLLAQGKALLDVGGIIFSVVLVLLTYYVSTTVGDNYELVAWTENIKPPDRDRQSARPDPQEPKKLALHLFNAGTLAIGDQRELWNLQIENDEGIAIRLIEARSLRKDTVLREVASPSPSIISIDVGLLKGHAELAVEFQVAGGATPVEHFTLRTSLAGLPQPKVGESIEGRIVLPMAIGLFALLLVVLLRGAFRMRGLRGAGLVRLAKPPHTVLPPASRTGFILSVTLFVPLLAFFSAAIYAYFITYGLADHGALGLVRLATPPGVDGHAGEHRARVVNG